MKTVKEWLQQITTHAKLAEVCQKGFSEQEKNLLTSKGYQLYSGKVREVIATRDELLIFHTDRLSAFDRFIGYVPFKGLILTALSEFWFKTIANKIPSHFHSRPHERVLAVEALQPIKAEVIVRGYLAGSLLRAYEKGVRVFCGEKLPDNLQPYQALPQPIITPTTKAAVFEHDEDTTAEALISTGVVTETEWATISRLAFALFSLGQEIYGERGWLMVDTKYEFGRTANGAIKVIDEIHTPDSSRLWVRTSYEECLKQNKTPEMLDKEIVRRFLMERGFSGQGEVPEVPVSLLSELAAVYLKVYETLQGHDLVVTNDPLGPWLKRL